MDFVEAAKKAGLGDIAEQAAARLAESMPTTAPPVESTASKKKKLEDEHMASLAKQTATLEGGIKLVDNQTASMKQAADAERFKMARTAAAALAAQNGALGSGMRRAATRGDALALGAEQDVAAGNLQMRLAEQAARKLQAQLDFDVAGTQMIEAKKQYLDSNSAALSTDMLSIDNGFSDKKESVTVYTDSDAYAEAAKQRAYVNANYTPGTPEYKQLMDRINWHVQQEVG